MTEKFLLTLIFLVTFVLCAGGAVIRDGKEAHPLLAGLIGSSLLTAISWMLIIRMPAGAAGVAQRVNFPTGESTPYEEQFSFEESLAARGDVPAALEAFERVIAERPGAVAPRMRAAELYASRGANPHRAAELFREIRAIPGVAGRDAVYACSRLVDLYDGALDEPGRALVELRRIIELYPGTPVAAHARDALPRMKTRLRDAAL